MNPAYYDTAYLFKTTGSEPDSAAILQHLQQVSHIACSLHGRPEFASICHRKFREGNLTRPALEALLQRLADDTRDGVVHWLPITPEVITRVEALYRTAPASTFLRAADALHLACAAENGFTEIFSNDRQLLLAAPLFGLRGIDLTSPPPPSP